MNAPEHIPSFDIIIIGAGCAGLQLLYQFSQRKDWSGLKVLLVDDGAAKQRSWCFWSSEQHPLQHLVTKTWHQLSFSSAAFSKTQTIGPYGYHYIPGDVFFEYFSREFIPAHHNITQVSGRVNQIQPNNGSYLIKTDDYVAWGKTCFSSIPANKGQADELKQHFKGWYIEADHEVFDTSTASLMDYSVQLYQDVHFIYVLPFSKTHALIEATFFSSKIAEDEVYDELISNYMQYTYAGVNFVVTSAEKGCIPMSRQTFKRFGQAGEVLIGQAAGMVKASTGYTFNRITQDSIWLARNLNISLPNAQTGTGGRFRFYDRLLLNIIRKKPQLVAGIFTRLFRYNSSARVLRFLDERTKPIHEFAIFWSLPWLPFIKETIKYIIDNDG
ncbi:lycopene cyclase family protein [Mucilaginibacter sp. CSA2-8R]|uniref:lycopene cyclase family protein n=1 Tax=Mucilaginibacter sp. CSA2-8R TaxID=3141542 RepID=UPI00315D5AE7